MNNTETLKRIHNEFIALREQIENTGTDEEWFNNAVEQGLIPGDKFKVYKKLESWGPNITIYVYKNNGTYQGKLVGTAEYTAFNDKWEIKNF